MLDPHRLRFLRELSVRGTISATAQSLAYTPSAVSQALSALERDIGTKLLERRGRNVVLTPAGASLVESSDAVFSALEAATTAVAETIDRQSGLLRIGSITSAFLALLPDTISGLSERHPDIDLHVTELGDDVDLREQLRLGATDLALGQHYTVLPDHDMSGLHSEVLFTEPLYIVAPASAPEDMEELATYPWAMSGPDPIAGGSSLNECGSVTRWVCEQHGIEPMTRFHTDNQFVFLHLAAMGTAVSVLPAICCLQVPEGVRITRVEGLVREIRVLMRQTSVQLPIIRSVLDELAKSADKVVRQIEAMGSALV